MGGVPGQLQVRTIAGLTKAILRQLAAINDVPDRVASSRAPLVLKPVKGGGVTRTVLVPCSPMASNGTASTIAR
jgi:hypothetical protein